MNQEQADLIEDLLKPNLYELVDLRPKMSSLSEAAEQHAAGMIVCQECKSPVGTLEGTRFLCNTPGCKWERKTAVSPWVKNGK